MSFEKKMAKPLKFCHIPKTGGITIMHMAERKGIKWGVIDQDYYGTRWKTPRGESYVHQPLYQSADPQFYKNILEKYDFFCVVRDPYERAISEFYSQWGGAPNKDLDVDDFNSHIQMRVGQRLISDHWAAQSYFVYHHDLENGKWVQKHQIIKYILRFENLESDFHKLMEAYNMDIKLEVHLNPGNKKFGFSDLTDQTRNVIEDVYAKDFENFGYPHRHPEVSEMVVSES